MERSSRTPIIVMVIGAALFALALPGQGPVAGPSLRLLAGVSAVAVALIVDVQAGSAADQAGLAVGDLLVSLNDTDLGQYPDLQSFVHALRETPLRSQAVLGYWKYDAPSESYSPRTTALRRSTNPGDVIGFNTSLRVVVVDVPAGGASEVAGLKQWDFIDRINGEIVSNLPRTDEIDRRLAEAAARDGKVRLLVARWKPKPTASGHQFVADARREVTLSLPRPGPSAD